MAYPVPITVPSNPARPTEADYIKHVDYFGENDNDFQFEYRKLERTLLFEYLRRADNNGSFPNNLMSVSFSAPTVRNGSNNLCVDILKRNIFCEGRCYRYLGHSGSQFWEKKCYLMNASEDDIHDLLARFDNFVKITDVRKRAKRINLLFVGFEHILDLPGDDYIVEPDVKSGFFGTKPRAFTNSCGFMSPEFTIKVRRQLGLSYPEPSAIQVNYQGFQGTLVLKDVHTNAPQVQLRKSMQIFNIPSEEVRQHIPFIGILDYSKPHINGYLDTRLIILLQSRGVSVNYLQTLHKDYIDLLRRILDDPASAQYFLRLKGKDDGNIRSEIDRPTREVLTTIKRNEIEEMIDRRCVLDAERRPVARVRILVPKARVVFGVCDPHGKLKKGQCYFKPTLLDDEVGELSSEEQIVVVCYPCYHPGDIQVLTLTHEKPGYENLKDCLVLPGKGHAFESCGGDLGGSKFFVSWDQQLIPEGTIQPCSYSTKNKCTFRALARVCANVKWLLKWNRDKRNRERKKRCRAELIEHFANFTDDLPQRIEKTYMKLAVTLGPHSKECKQLSKMSYQAANQTVDRDVLSQKLAKLIKKNESRGTMSSAEASSSEGSPLLRAREEGEEEPGNGNEDEDETRVEMTNLDGTGAVRFLCGSRRETSEMRHELWKFEERAKKFVEEALQEYPYV